MEVTLEGSNSAETPPPWGGVIGLHRPVTGNLARAPTSMGFWKGWALWQKLSIALAFLLLLVLVYSFSILTYNRRKLRKQAAEEANQRAEEGAEVVEIHSESNEIPFGATALEKGIEVEGIWTMKRHSLIRPASIMEKRRSSVLGSLLRPKSVASSIHTPRTIEVQTPRAVENDPLQALNALDGQADVLESIHIDTFRSSRPPKLNIGGIGSSDGQKLDRPLSRGWFASRSSWMKPIVGYKRMSAREGRRRGSSEDYRRRFSKLFDETLPPGPPRPTEKFQLTPIYQGSSESIGNESLDKTIGPVATK
ncbi:hypothetical protein BJY04DRAFT_211784 [Aspergillus karnatakaensis]|uniref:uncharacterized protein n=1 Tax=Aspergillus karnatakaensis TaxID=1810916 RepID=UPI003CCCD707